MITTGTISKHDVAVRFSKLNSTFAICAPPAFLLAYLPCRNSARRSSPSLLSSTATFTAVETSKGRKRTIRRARHRFEPRSSPTNKRGCFIWGLLPKRLGRLSPSRRSPRRAEFRVALKFDVIYAPGATGVTDEGVKVRVCVCLFSFA